MQEIAQEESRIPLPPKASSSLRFLIYGLKLTAAGNDLTYAHYDDLPHGFIQMTRHSKRCLESTLEIARLLGEALRKTRAAAAKL